MTPRAALRALLVANGALANNSELVALGFTPTEALRIVLAAEEPLLAAGGANYDRRSALELRSSMVQLRDAALKEGQMEWSVVISHMIALWSEMVDQIWEDQASAAD